MVSKRVRAQASSRDVPLVKNLIERCIQLYMTKKEAVDILQAQAGIMPDVTELVWQTLEEQNREFFQAYYLRLMLKKQILQFNKLLEQQARLMGQIHSTGASSSSNSNEHQMPLVPRNSSCHALQNTGSALNRYHVRLMVNQQILDFNKLLEQQVRLMCQIHSTGASSTSNSNEPQMPLVPKNLSCYALLNTGSALKEEDMHQPMESSLPNVFNNGGSSRGRRQRRGEDVVHPLMVSLEDLYLGTSKKLSLPCNMICSKSNGKGSKSGILLQCPGCQGKVSIRHLYPSMIQKMQHPCNDCKSTGEMINDKDYCPQCKGEKVVQEKKVFEVHVEKGMQNGQKITFPGEADEAPDTITGDIVFVLQQKDHPKFKRKGEDLFVEHTLSLTEALCGFHFVVTHLDGRQLLIKSNPGEVVKPDSFKAINDEGMPLYQKPFMKGRMYIHFTVEFPDSLNPDQIKAIEAILPPKPTSQLTDMELDECEETTLHDVKHRRVDDEAAGSTGQEAYDEDEEMHGGPLRVQCAQQ